MVEVKKEKDTIKKTGILFGGIVNVCGESDSGKTTFALGNGAHPSKILFIDDDVKGQGLADALAEAGTPFGKYVNLVSETVGMKETTFHAYCKKLIDSIEPGQYDCIIWDTFTRFEKSCHPYVATHQAEFRERWSPHGTIRNSEVWIEAQRYEAQILDQMQKKAPLVIVVSHMKDENRNGIRTGKRVPDCMKPVIQKSTMRVLLHHDERGLAAPTGLLLKRIGKRVLTDEGIETMNVLPLKLRDFTWKTIRKYWENPIGNAEPEAENIPNEFEMSMLDSSTMTEDQRLMLRLTLKGVAEEEAESTAAMKNDMLQMKADGKTLAEIAESYDISIKEVAQFLV